MRYTCRIDNFLTRPVTVIANYEDGDPLTGPRDADIVTTTSYDAVGRVERQIDNVVDSTFTATEPITDRITLFDYDALSRPITTTFVLDPATLLTRTDTNRTSVTAYEALTGRMLGQQDALGRWVSMQYDALGRVTTSIQNCRDGGGDPVASDCDAFDDQEPDRNIPWTTRYDALGRAWETEDALGVVTRQVFDGVGRTITTIQNYDDGIFDSGAPDTDVTTTMAYDALGRTVVMTDATGIATTMAYDGLGFTSVITDAVGRATRQGADGTGALRWAESPDGIFTVMFVDGLGRVVTTIANYEDGEVTETDGTDRDLMTHSVFDAAGRVERTIDATGRITQFAYDNLDRLIAVTENVADGSCAQAPCTVITEYTYDRAGNRTAIIDANDNTRTFAYDAANQLVTQTDALSQATSWTYDRGGRMLVQDDPRGADYDLSYSYDALDRLTELNATELAAPINMIYDALGRRAALDDATGMTEFSYDDLGRIIAVDAPDTGVVGYDYDAAGRRTALTYPDSTVVGYTYTAAGELDTVTQSSTTLADYGYDSAGRLESVARANDAATTYSYDAVGRLTDLRTQVDTAD
ncbi:MAG TPA: hypothetical protein PKC19_20215, partial [Roseiflexaceae bacterium]|nr:hypothetical protein [Roseiflexaceae bacterium]